ncbi:MAG: lipopolysaccharide biosynthesis protein [Nitrospinota bacterium]
MKKMKEALGYKKVFVKNTSLSAVQQAITVIVNILLLPYMVWHMGADNYGYWLILKLFGIGGYITLAEFGLYGSIVRYLTRYKTENNTGEFNRLYVSSLGLYFLIGLICASAIILFAYYALFTVFAIPNELHDDMYSGLVLYGLVLLVQFPAFAVKAYYISVNDFYHLKIWESLNPVLFAASIYILMHFAADIKMIVATDVVVTVLLFALFLLLPYKLDKSYSLKLNYYSSESIRNVSSLTYYIFLTKIIGLIYTSTPQIIISLTMLPKYMTYYHIVTRFPRIIKMIQTVGHSALLPLAVTLDTKREHLRNKRLFIRSTRYALMIIGPILMFGLFYSDEIIFVWMGSGFAWLGKFQFHFLILQFLTVFISIGTAMYIKSAQYREFLPYNITAGLLYIVITTLNIDRLGIWSIIIGLYVTQAIIIIANYIVIQNTHRFSLKEYFNEAVKSPVLFGIAFCWALLSVFESIKEANNLSVLVIYASLMLTAYIYAVYKYGLFEHEKAELSAILCGKEIKI